MIKIAKQIGTQLVLVYIPSAPYENDYPLKRMSEWGRHNGVLVIDTLLALNEAAKKEKVYWTKDVHCNEKGYNVIVENVYRCILKNKLIESF